MASPQLENGHTRIANELIEKLALFPWPEKTATPLKLCLFVIRKTYGYQKKTDVISLTQFQKGINSNRPSVVHWLQYLVKANILVKASELSKNGFMYGLNKNFDDWKWLVKASELVKARVYTSNGALTKTSNGALTHKRKKENTKEKENDFQEEYIRLVEVFKPINIAYRNLYGNKTSRGAFNSLKGLVEFDEILAAAEYAVSINGLNYAPTIINPYQLMEKWQSLINYKTKK